MITFNSNRRPRYLMVKHFWYFRLASSSVQRALRSPRIILKRVVEGFALCFVFWGFTLPYYGQVGCIGIIATARPYGRTGRFPARAGSHYKGLQLIVIIRCSQRLPIHWLLVYIASCRVTPIYINGLMFVGGWLVDVGSVCLLESLFFIIDLGMAHCLVLWILFK